MPINTKSAVVIHLVDIYSFLFHGTGCSGWVRESTFVPSSRYQMETWFTWPTRLTSQLGPRNMEEEDERWKNKCLLKWVSIALHLAMVEMYTSMVIFEVLYSSLSPLKPNHHPSSRPGAGVDEHGKWWPPYGWANGVNTSVPVTRNHYKPVKTCHSGWGYRSNL